MLPQNLGVRMKTTKNEKVIVENLNNNIAISLYSLEKGFVSTLELSYQDIVYLINELQSALYESLSTRTEPKE